MERFRPEFSCSKTDQQSKQLQELNAPKTEANGYIGIDMLNDQLRRKVVKRGFEYNIMLVGSSGLGKSTMVNTIFRSNVSRRSCHLDLKVPSDGGEKAKVEQNNNEVPEMMPYLIPKSVEVLSVSHEIEEKGVRVRLTITDTPGFGDHINNDKCWEPIVEYINEQYEKYLVEEVNVARKRIIPDSRVHCCLYFIPPTGHSLRPLDIEFMKKLGDIVNIVPVIAKADTLTLDERKDFKKRIQDDIKKHNIKIYPSVESEVDEEDRQINDRIRQMLPFAVVGGNKLETVEKKGKVLGRKTNWGIIEIENRQHCEFADLRDLLIRTHMQDLKDVTDQIHYEAYRQDHLKAPGSPQKMPRKEKHATKPAAENKATVKPMPNVPEKLPEKDEKNTSPTEIKKTLKIVVSENPKIVEKPLKEKTDDVIHDKKQLKTGMKVLPTGADVTKVKPMMNGNLKNVDYAQINEISESNIMV